MGTLGSWLCDGCKPIYGLLTNWQWNTSPLVGSACPHFWPPRPPPLSVLGSTYPPPRHCICLLCEISSNLLTPRRVGLLKSFEWFLPLKAQFCELLATLNLKKSLHLFGAGVGERRWDLCRFLDLIRPLGSECSLLWIGLLLE